MYQKNSKLYLIIKFFLTIIILYLLFKSIKFDLNELIEAFKTVKPVWIFPALSGVIIVLSLKSYRWHLLLNHSDIKFSFKDTWKSYFSSYSMGIITPGRVGEFVKIYNVRQKTGAGFITSFRTALSDRLFDLMILIVFALCWFIKQGLNADINDFTIITIGIIIICLMLLIIRMILHRFSLVKIEKINTIIRFLYSCMIDLTEKRSIGIWLISLLAYFFYFLTTWFLLRSLTISLSLIDTGYIISIVGLIILLPITIAGFGTREASLIYLLSLYGIESEPALIFSIIHFFIFFVWGGLVGLVVWIINPIPISIIKTDSKRIFSAIKSAE